MVTLQAEGLRFGYGNREVLAGVDLAVRDGELLGLCGPNGAGKSTLLRCCHGALQPRQGTVALDGVALARLGPRRIAQRLAVVPQSAAAAFPLRVEEFVGLGRFPHERFLGGTTPHDRAVVQRCLQELDLLPLAQRATDQLSGGEFRRVLIAQALAQEPDLLLFDEPIQQLDLRHQLEVMEFARAFAHRPGKAGIVVLHDLTLAARFCDRLLLLHDGRVLAAGPPAEVLTHPNVRTAYGIEARISADGPDGTLVVTPLRPA